MDLPSPAGLPADVLWNGLLGSIVAAVVAALVAVLVVFLSNRSARRSWYDQRRIASFEQVLEAFNRCWEISGRGWEGFPDPSEVDDEKVSESATSIAQGNMHSQTDELLEPVARSAEEWAFRVTEVARRHARLQAWAEGLEIPQRMVSACPEHPEFDRARVSADDPDLREEVEWEDRQFTNAHAPDTYSRYLHIVFSQRDQELEAAVGDVSNKIALWRLYLRPRMHNEIEKATYRAIEVLYGEWEYSGYMGRGSPRMELPRGFDQEWNQFRDTAAQWHRSGTLGKAVANRHLSRVFQMPAKTKQDIMADHVGEQLRFSVE